MTKLLRLAAGTVAIMLGSAGFGALLAKAQSDPPYYPPHHETLESIGKRYGVPGPGVQPAISRERALELAREWSPALAAQATSISAQFVLFSDDRYGAEDEYGNKLTPIYQNVPAWVVTFNGVQIPSMMPPLSYNSEMNVVFNATTGEYLEAFSYK